MKKQSLIELKDIPSLWNTLLAIIKARRSRRNSTTHDRSHNVCICRLKILKRYFEVFEPLRPGNLNEMQKDNACISIESVIRH